MVSLTAQWSLRNVVKGRIVCQMLNAVGVHKEVYNRGLEQTGFFVKVVKLALKVSGQGF